MSSSAAMSRLTAATPLPRFPALRQRGEHTLLFVAVQSQPAAAGRLMSSQATKRYSGDTITPSSLPPISATSTTSRRMMQPTSTSSTGHSSVIGLEVNKFSAMAADWWDPTGSVAPLHTMNPLRVKYIKDQVLAHRPRKPTLQQQHSLNPTTHPLAGYRILDVGCGGGLLSESLARLGAEVHGIDATLAAVQIAKQHVATDDDIRQRITYECVPAEELLQRPNLQKYDIVCGLEIIEHVNSPAEFINTLKQLTKPGGALFVSTLNQTWKSYMLAIIGAEYVLGLLTRGTHDWNKFVPPALLTRWITAPLQRGDSTSQSTTTRNTYISSIAPPNVSTDEQPFNVMDMQGILYNPFSGNMWLDRTDLDVNYILYARSRLDSVDPTSTEATEASNVDDRTTQFAAGT